jgi:predicted ATPase/class 3 adenylate cyclase
MTGAWRDLPEGTVTMVFTDIAGSTALLRELGDRYAGVLAEHRTRLRAIVERHHGFEVDTQGDAFFLVFRRASDGLAAAREAVSEPGGDPAVRIRVGVHTGEPARSEEGYTGIDVHVAARIAASGSGGQIVVSRQTRELTVAEPLRDLGVHRLKDVGEVQLFQLGDEQFPPLRSIGGSNLTAPREAPLGRERELAELRAMVVDEGARLVTLTGAGGIGKTTLARAVAAALGERFPDGVWFVDLSPIAEADLVETEVAAVVGSNGNVADHLRASTALLVLDNFERVLDAADAVASWLAADPRLVVLATSRERLHLTSEREYPVGPLDEQSAAQLFIRRAGAVGPGHTISDDEVRRLCRRLDGIPLAVELAAARARLLPPAQLLARLDQRFSLLTGGARDLPARQRALEATVDWSHDLLNADERQLFRRLSVFAGGWTLEAAEDVAGADIDRLESLVTKSLVLAADGRFTMLETLRDYAAVKLADDEAADVRRRHAHHYAVLPERAADELTGPRQDAWLELLAAEDDNLRAALGWCLEDPDSHELGLRMGADLVLFWYLRSRHWEGWRWLEPLLKHSQPTDSPARAAALWGAGFFLTVIADQRAGGFLQDALDMARRVGDAGLIARSLDVMGLLAFFGNDLRGAQACLEESIAQARAARDDWCLADALGTIGSVYPLVGRLEQGRAAGIEGLELARRRGDLQGVRMSLFGLALTARRADDPDAAIRAGEEGLNVSRRLVDAFFTSYFLWLLAGAEHDRGALDQARVLADEALELARALEVPLLLLCALEVRGSLHVDEGEVDQARLLLEEAERVGAESSVPGSYLSEALRLLGRLEAEAGDVDGARNRLTAALELARSVMDPWAERRAAADLEWLSRDAGTR